MSLVECIPNVSEGRRAEVLDALAGVFAARDEVRLLHVHPDVDHNRTVYTVVGEPTGLLESIEELYARAVDSIDLRLHHGVHPRVGAADVCPFVPLPEHGSPMDECVELPPKGQRSVFHAPYRAMVKQLRSGGVEGGRFDLAILFPNSMRSAVIAFLAGARRRVGYNRDGRGLRLTDAVAIRHKRNGVATVRDVLRSDCVIPVFVSSSAECSSGKNWHPLNCP